MFSHGNPEQEELIRHIRRFAGRLRLRDGWRGMQNTLWAAMLAALLVQTAGRLLPIPNLLAWTLLPLGIWLIGNLLLAFFLPQPPLRVARRVDLELNLKERLSSSLAFASAMPEGPSKGWFMASLVEDLHRDALQAARQVDVRHAFPLRVVRRPLIIAGILLLATLIMAFAPNPMDAVLAQRAAVAQAAQQQAAQIEKLKEEIAKSEQLSPEEREELLKKLAELAEKLKANKGDLEKALADLAKLEEELRQQLDPAFPAQQAALDALLSQLEELAKQNGIQPPADMEKADLLEELIKQLEEMDEAEKEALAEALAQMSAQAAQAGGSELAQALAEMAQAAQSGDSQSAQNAAQKASEALKNAQKNADAKAAAQAAINQAMSQMQAGRQALANAAAQSSSNTQGNQSSQGSPGQGQNPGNQPGSGQGSKADTLPPFTGSGKPKPPTGDPGAQKPAGENQGEGPAYQEQGGKGDELFIPGIDTGQGQEEEKQKEDPLGGLDTPSLVPYQQVYSTYRDAASQAIDKSYIPLGLKDYVRQYFTQLEPQPSEGGE